MRKGPVSPSGLPFAVSRDEVEQIFPNIKEDALRALTEGMPLSRDEHQLLLLRPLHLRRIELGRDEGINIVSTGKSRKKFSLNGITREGIMKLLEDKSIRVKLKKKSEEQ